MIYLLLCCRLGQAFLELNQLHRLIYHEDQTLTLKTARLPLGPKDSFVFAAASQSRELTLGLEVVLWITGNNKTQQLQCRSDPRLVLCFIDSQQFSPFAGKDVFIKIELRARKSGRMTYFARLFNLTELDTLSTRSQPPSIIKVQEVQLFLASLKVDWDKVEDYFLVQVRSAEASRNPSSQIFGWVVCQTQQKEISFQQQFDSSVFVQLGKEVSRVNKRLMFIVCTISIAVPAFSFTNVKVREGISEEQVLRDRIVTIQSLSGQQVKFYFVPSDSTKYISVQLHTFVGHLSISSNVLDYKEEVNHGAKVAAFFVPNNKNNSLLLTCASGSSFCKAILSIQYSNDSPVIYYGQYYTWDRSIGLDLLKFTAQRGNKWVVIVDNFQGFNQNVTTPRIINAKSRKAIQFENRKYIGSQFYLRAKSQVCEGDLLCQLQISFPFSALNIFRFKIQQRVPVEVLGERAFYGMLDALQQQIFQVFQPQIELITFHINVHSGNATFYVASKIDGTDYEKVIGTLVDHTKPVEIRSSSGYFYLQVCASTLLWYDVRAERNDLRPQYLQRDKTIYFTMKENRNELQLYSVMEYRSIVFVRKSFGDFELNYKLDGQSIAVGNFESIGPGELSIKATKTKEYQGEEVQFSILLRTQGGQNLICSLEKQSQPFQILTFENSRTCFLYLLQPRHDYWVSLSSDITCRQLPHLMALGGGKLIEGNSHSIIMYDLATFHSGQVAIDVVVISYEECRVVVNVQDLSSPVLRISQGISFSIKLEPKRIFQYKRIGRDSIFYKLHAKKSSAKVVILNQQANATEEFTLQQNQHRFGFITADKFKIQATANPPGTNFTIFVEERLHELPIFELPIMADRPLVFKYQSYSNSQKQLHVKGKHFNLVQCRKIDPEMNEELLIANTAKIARTGRFVVICSSKIHTRISAYVQDKSEEGFIGTTEIVPEVKYTVCLTAHQYGFFEYQCIGLDIQLHVQNFQHFEFKTCQNIILDSPQQLQLKFKLVQPLKNEKSTINCKSGILMVRYYAKEQNQKEQSFKLSLSSGGSKSGRLVFGKLLNLQQKDQELSNFLMTTALDVLDFYVYSGQIKVTVKQKDITVHEEELKFGRHRIVLFQDTDRAMYNAKYEVKARSLTANCSFQVSENYALKLAGTGTHYSKFFTNSTIKEYFYLGESHNLNIIVEASDPQAETRLHLSVRYLNRHSQGENLAVKQSSFKTLHIFAVEMAPVGFYQIQVTKDEEFNLATVNMIISDPSMTFFQPNHLVLWQLESSQTSSFQLGSESYSSTLLQIVDCNGNTNFQIYSNLENRTKSNYTNIANDDGRNIIILSYNDWFYLQLYPGPDVSQGSLVSLRYSPIDDSLANELPNFKLENGLLDIYYDIVKDQVTITTDRVFVPSSLKSARFRIFITEFKSNVKSLRNCGLGKRLTQRQFQLAPFNGVIQPTTVRLNLAGLLNRRRFLRAYLVGSVQFQHKGLLINLPFDQTQFLARTSRRWEYKSIGVRLLIVILILASVLVFIRDRKQSSAQNRGQIISQMRMAAQQQ